MSGERASRQAGHLSRERGRSLTEDRRGKAPRLIARIPSALLGALGLLAMAATGFAVLALQTRRARQAAEHSALTDPLTGLANRPAFYHRLAVEWERATRSERPTGVIVLDLDGFKEVNDTHGHAASPDRAVGRAN